MILTLTEYTKYELGFATPPEAFANRDVVIPVRQDWSGNSWLTPYILSFTTSGWWNHSVTMDLEFIGDATGQPMSDWRARYLAQASLPVVRGGFGIIWLVSVNTTGPSAQAPLFAIGNADQELVLQYGVPNGDFALHAYSWLGRAGPEAVVEVLDRSADMSNTWSRLLDTITVEGVATKALATAAELTRIRWNGNLVKTSSRPADGEHGGVRLPPRTIGLARAARLHVAGRIVPDWNALLGNGGQGVIRAIGVATSWRATPLCNMHKSVAWTGVGAGHDENSPCWGGWEETEAEYRLTESYSVNRILIARDIFVHAPSSRKYQFRNDCAVSVFLSESSSLIGGVANWVYAYRGFTLTGVNRLYPLDRNVPRQLLELMTYATNNLFISLYGRPWAPYRVFDLLAMLRLEMPWEQFMYNRWMSLALPWWFVLAVAEKFGNRQKVVCPVEEACLNDDDPDVYVNGYAIDKNLTWPTLPSLTSDDRYWDHHNYNIVGFRDRHYDMETWCAWNSDLGFDSVVLTQCRPLGESTTNPHLVDINKKKDF